MVIIILPSLVLCVYLFTFFTRTYFLIGPWAVELAHKWIRVELNRNIIIIIIIIIG
jgi:hypothetical protein